MAYGSESRAFLRLPIPGGLHHQYIRIYLQQAQAADPLAWGDRASDRGVDRQSALGGHWLGASASISHPGS